MESLPMDVGRTDLVCGKVWPGEVGTMVACIMPSNSAVPLVTIHDSSICFLEIKYYGMHEGEIKKKIEFCYLKVFFVFLKHMKVHMMRSSLYFRHMTNNEH